MSMLLLDVPAWKEMRQMRGEGVPPLGEVAIV